MSVTDMSLRLSPSGAELVGENAGDILTWDPTVRKWKSGPNTGAITEFDHIITDRLSLVAAVGSPVAGEFTLPSGSYFFKEPLDLDPGEFLAVAQDARVLIMGGGANKEVQGGTGATAATLVARTGCALDLISLALAAPTAGQPAFVSEGTAETRAQSCLFRGIASTTCAEQRGTGNFSATQCVFSGGQSGGFEQNDGSVTLTACRLDGGASNGFRMVGASVMNAILTACQISGNGASAAGLMNGANTDLSAVNCFWSVDNDGTHCFQILQASSVNIRGGEIFSTAGTPGDGVSVEGNVTGGIQLSGIAFANLDDAITRMAGTQNRVTIMGCDSAADVAVGVDWATANIPTNGLLAVGNQWNTLTPLQNFTAADARVNWKANSLFGGLSTETAIVP